jgi:transketolase
MTANDVRAPAAARSARETYRDLVAELLVQDERLVCLDSDTGLFGGVDFGPARDRYINVGIAEHTLMGVAAGLAREGRIPLVNTMAAFAATRALEAVKVDIALNDLPVRIVASHSGVSAGHLGPTHHALADLAIFRVLPNMTVLVPADAASAGQMFRQCLDLPGPVYLRLGRNATPDLPDGAPPVRLGEAQTLRTGTDVTLAACGPYPVHAALDAATELAEAGIDATVLNLHTVKPLDVAALRRSALETGAVLTVEEHWRDGGFGGAVTEALAEHDGVRVVRMGMPDEFVPVAGGQLYQLERAGLTAPAVAARARALLGR